MDSPPVDLPASFLGIDGGGTKTAWALLSGAAVLLDEVPTGLQLATMGSARAADQLLSIVELAQRAAPAPIAGVVAGMAGAGSVAARRELAAALTARGAQLPIVLAGDPEVAAAAALAEGPGVAVWAGTGSFAIARTSAGGLVRVGGRGWLLGDQGSAFDLARRGAAAALAAVDGLGPETSLTAAFQQACGLSDPRDLGRHLQGLPPAALAAHGTLLLQALADGDAVARAIVAGAAHALAELALAAAARAALPLAGLQVALGGGLLARAATLRDAIGVELGGRGLQSPPQLCATPAALGAARLARARAQGVRPMSTWVGDDGVV